MGNLITAIDFGSSKIVVAVGEKTANGIRIRSCNSAPVTGIRGGEIINDKRVVDTLRPLLRKAEEECGESIESAVIGLSGKFIRSKEISARSSRMDFDKYITEDEIKALSAEQFDKELGEDEMVFDVIPQKFNVDDQIGLGINDVVGMRGGVIEGFFRMFYGKEKLYSSRCKILEECGLKVKKFVLSPIASAAAVLTKQETENGVVLVDIGKGLTEIAIIKDNIVREVATIPFAGESVTNDIKIVTNLTGDWAERVKIRFGGCLEEYTPENKQLVLRGEDNVEEGSVELSLLNRIVEARMSEILDAVDYVIAGSGYDGKLPSGIVITGGSGYMEHIQQLAKVLLGRKVRLAAPRSSITADSAMTALDADASTAVGLVIEGIAGKLSYTREKPVQKKTSDAEQSTKRTIKPFGSIFDSFFASDDEDDESVAMELREKREREAREKEEAKRRKKEEDEKRKEMERKLKEEEKKRREEEEKKRRDEERMAREQQRQIRAAAGMQEPEPEIEEEIQPEKNTKTGKETLRDRGMKAFKGFIGDLFTEDNDKA